jgi:hypothetical protein
MYCAVADYLGSGMGYLSYETLTACLLFAILAIDMERKYVHAHPGAYRLLPYSNENHTFCTFTHVDLPDISNLCHCSGFTKYRSTTCDKKFNIMT